MLEWGEIPDWYEEGQGRVENEGEDDVYDL
jgi:hypothetical protein